MRLQTGVGEIELKVWYGWDPASRRWGCPMRQRWGLGVRQRKSPLLEDRLAFTVTATGSYREAAVLAQKWGCQVEETSLYELTQRLGERAEQQMEQRLEGAPEELEAGRAASELAVFMMDGWQLRYRGPGWGKKKTLRKRVEWHEMKLGVFYLQEQAGRTQSGRGLICQKVVVGWQGQGVELGRRLHWEAQRRGLGRAKWVVVVGDGAPWIWNVAADRWANAQEVLDFYHASEHLWELGRALYGEEQARPWVESRLHELRHGQEERFLARVARLKVPRGAAGEIVREQKNYFAN
jgi:hypothetical protein